MFAVNEQPTTLDDAPRARGLVAAGVIFKQHGQIARFELTETLTTPASATWHLGVYPRRNPQPMQLVG